MPSTKSRRLAIDMIPVVLLIGYGVIEPMIGAITVPIGIVLLIWAIYRYRKASS